MTSSTPLAPTGRQPVGPPRATNGLAVGALVIGILAFLTGLIPFVGLIGGVVAVLLGVMALGRRTGRGMGITGLVLGAVGGLTGLITTILLIVGLMSGATSATSARGAGAGAAVVAAPATTASSSSSPAVAATEKPAMKAAKSEVPSPAASAVKTEVRASSPKAGSEYGGYSKSEARFVKIVNDAATEYGDTSNELKGAKILKTRDRNACATAGSKIRSWVGTIHSIGATGDGDGWVEIEIAPTIAIETWNNSLSDAFDSTLIPQSAGFFDRLSNMEEGDKVVFSGTFVSSDDSCLSTTNMTKTFNAADPNFLFRFSNIRPQ